MYSTRLPENKRKKLKIKAIPSHYCPTPPFTFGIPRPRTSIPTNRNSTSVLPYSLVAERRRRRLLLLLLLLLLLWCYCAKHAVACSPSHHTKAPLWNPLPRHPAHLPKVVARSGGAEQVWCSSGSMRRRVSSSRRLRTSCFRCELRSLWARTVALMVSVLRLALARTLAAARRLFSRREPVAAAVVGWGDFWCCCCWCCSWR